MERVARCSATADRFRCRRTIACTSAADGTVSIQPEGQGPEALVQLDRIKLVKPDHGARLKAKTVCCTRIPVRRWRRVPTSPLESGTLEGSNVNAVNEMTSILELARQFDLEVRLMKSAEQNDEAASQLLQVN